MIPLTKGNVEAQPGEGRADFRRGAHESLSRSIDPRNRVLGMPRFAIAVDDI